MATYKMNTHSEHYLQIQNLTISLSQTKILHGVSLNMQAGEIGCLLGPSGCGKTTLLRAIAGFSKPEEGHIHIANELVSNKHKVLAVEKRQIGMVFQDFALFPHLTVYENIAFGLKQKKHKIKDIDSRVTSLLTLIELSDKATAYPHELSGGQQQRIALARALAPKPRLILLDEPFSSIDQAMRDSLAMKIRYILKQENATAIMVTHDQTEAYAMADKIGVMNEGSLLQWDNPMKLYKKPVSKFVAKFIGESTFLKAKIVAKTEIETVFGRHGVNSEEIQESDIGTNKLLLVRPNNVELEQDGILATIEHQFFKGASFIYLLKLYNGEQILAQFQTNHTESFETNQQVCIKLNLENTLLY